MRREAQAASRRTDPYRRALQLYRDGQSEQAIQQFRDFLRANPKSPLADNAQYWIGEAYFAQGDYNRSIIELNEVLLKYPQGDQVPGALLALATAFANSGDKIDAKLILQKLISDHPKSEEAQIGRQQLQTLDRLSVVAASGTRRRMMLVRHLTRVEAAARPRVVASGGFDGVHRGHQRVLAASRGGGARATRAEAVIALRHRPGDVRARQICASSWNG